MSELWKKIISVVVGFATVFVLSVLTDTILEKIGVFPPASNGLFVTWMLLVALFYRCIYAVLGGYVTARLAGKGYMKQVWILAVIGLIGAIIGIWVNYTSHLGPNWYPIWLAVLTIPCVWLGGKFR